VLGAVLLETTARRHFATLRHLGDESYAIYLLHLPILAVLYKGVGALHNTGRFFLAGVSVVSLITCIASAALFHRSVEVKVTRLARRRMERWIGVV
jgi:peptidoglycan/LPS O-acetylase OafA/YrhL